MSQLPLKMKQGAALKARQHEVLPIPLHERFYSIDIHFEEKPKVSDFFLVCSDLNKKPLWRKSVLSFAHFDGLETDLQDRFVVGLRAEGNLIAVEFECDGTFRFDAMTGSKVEDNR